MMKLSLVYKTESQKEKNGAVYHATRYYVMNNGEEAIYSVTVFKTTYPNTAEPFIRIETVPCCKNTLVPSIYFCDGYIEDEKPHFTIQTTSYGALTLDEFGQFLEAQKLANGTAALLTEKILGGLYQ